MTSDDSSVADNRRRIWNAAFAGPRPPLARCPYDFVASFLSRFSPPDRQRTTIEVLELGFGSGANLWFAARQGFRVAGVDISDRALQEARNLLATDGLTGDLRRSDFSPLPFSDDSFDLAFDRGALCTVDLDEAARAIAEVHRVLRPEGKFFFNPFSTADSSASGPPEQRERTPWAYSEVFFYEDSDIERVLGSGWRLHELLHVTEVDELRADGPCRAQWRAVAEVVDVG